MQFYRRNLPHLQRDFKPHFITFVTKTRCALPECARDITLSCCLHDHVHLILMPLINEQRREIFSLIDIMRGIKGASGRAINGCLGRHGPVWQEESFDHVLRCYESVDAKIEYILQNPVRNGLVTNWMAYRWAWERPDREVARMEVRSLGPQEPCRPGPIDKGSFCSRHSARGRP